jgi:hypothetical protein
MPVSSVVRVASPPRPLAAEARHRSLPELEKARVMEDRLVPVASLLVDLGAPQTSKRRISARREAVHAQAKARSAGWTQRLPRSLRGLGITPLQGRDFHEPLPLDRMKGSPLLRVHAALHGDQGSAWPPCGAHAPRACSAAATTRNGQRLRRLRPRRLPQRLSQLTRFGRPRSSIRGVHPWLGAGTMLLAAAQVFFGLEIHDGSIAVNSWGNSTSLLCLSFGRPAAGARSPRARDPTPPVHESRGARGRCPL